MKRTTTPIAKITRPNVSGVLPRSRLMTLLDKGSEHPITWVSGPAGSGKTTLAANYLDERKLPCLWYQIDAGDEDAATFFYYMGLATKKAAPRFRKPLPLLTPEYLHGISVYTQRFFEKLYTRLKPPFALVFDNYQEAPEQAPLHELVNLGLSLIPEGIQVFVLSRNEPPPAFMRLRANNAMRMVGWENLRFTLDESKQMVRQNAKQKLTEDALEELYRKTEGWAAGLVLLKESAGTKKPGPQSFGELDQREVFDYFAGEVFNKLDNETRDFLLMSSFLPAMTAKMAEKMTGQDNAGRILAGLNRNHFFTEKHQAGDPSYQYHALFREFLLTRMKESLNSESILRVQKRAAAILEDAGRGEDAVGLYLEACEWSDAARLINHHAAELIGNGRYGSVRSWIAGLPRETIEQSPDLLYWQGASLMPFDPSNSRLLFEKAMELFRARKNLVGIFQAWSGVVESILHELGDLRKLDRWVALLDELLLTYPELPQGVIGERVVSTMFMSLVMRNPRHPEFSLWRKRAFVVLERSADTTLRMFTGFYLLTYYLWLGDYGQAASLLEILRGIARPKEASPLAWITVQMAASWYQWLTGSNEASRKTMSDALERARESGVHIWDYLLRIQGVAASLSEGDLATAEGDLKKLSSVLERARRFDRFYFHHESAWYALLRNELPAALGHQETALRLAQEVGALFIETNGHLGMAQLMYEQGEYTRAREHLAQARRIAAPMNSALLECLSLLTEAYIAVDRGDEEMARKSLRAAMALGRKNNYMNFSWWRPPVMSRLCAKALEAGIEVEYVRGLIRKRKLQPDASLLVGESWPWPLKIFTLGRFELVKDGEPVKFSGKVQQKPLALLKALIAFGGKDVPEERITDALWPDADGDLAHRSFEMAVHRLRKLIGNDKIILLQERRLTLDTDLCWVDAWAFEKAVERAPDKDIRGQAAFGIRSEDGGEKGISIIHNPQSEINLEHFEKSLSLYKGHYLPSDTAHPWVLSYRERLRSKFLRAIIKLGTHREQATRWESAAEVFQKGLEVDDCAEEFYQQLMVCYEQLGQRAEAIAVYNRCSALLSSTLGIAPSPRTEELYQAIKNGR